MHLQCKQKRVTKEDVEETKTTRETSSSVVDTRGKKPNKNIDDAKIENS